MAAYPTTRQSHGSTMEIAGGTQPDRMESGKIRLRTYHSQIWRVFRLVHECTTAERDTILAHWSADKNNSFSMTFQGDTTAYTVKYVNKPQYRPVSGTYDWVVETILVTV